MPKHLALYARVSTGGQKLEPQLDPLRDYAHRRGGRVVEYVDHTSGAKARRTGLDALVAGPAGGARSKPSWWSSWTVWRAP